VIAPFFIILIAGLVLLLLRQKKTGAKLSMPAWMGVTAGLFYIGGAAVTTAQLIHTASLTGWVPQILVTLIFIGVPVILGILLFIISMNLKVPVPVPSRTAIELIMLGFLGFLFWCGFIVGPIIAICAGVLVLLKKN
jgi:hypothetical protein